MVCRVLWRLEQSLSLIPCKGCIRWGRLTPTGSYGCYLWQMKWMYSHMLRRARENSMSAWQGQRTLTNSWHFTDIKIGQFEQCEDWGTRTPSRKREREWKTGARKSISIFLPAELKCITSVHLIRLSSDWGT